jgi:nickel-type superoxide dismutase maturation protease
MPIAIFKVKDKSMQPSLNDGDYIIVSRVSYLFNSPKPSEIIVLKHPLNGMLIVKRIAHERNGMFYVTGDNAKESEDSRSFGYISRAAIFGKVLRIIRKG